MKSLILSVSFMCFFALDVSAKTLRMDILRVFMHMPGDYSVMYCQANNVIGVERIEGCWHLKDKQKEIGVIGKWIAKHNDSLVSNPFIKEQIIVTDVPEGKSMYLLVEHVPGGLFGRLLKVSIHIHSVKEVAGGEFEATRTGSHRPRGITKVIE